MMFYQFSKRTCSITVCNEKTKKKKNLKCVKKGPGFPGFNCMKESIMMAFSPSWEGMVRVYHYIQYTREEGKQPFYA